MTDEIREDFAQEIADATEETTVAATVIRQPKTIAPDRQAVPAEARPLDMTVPALRCARWRDG